MANNNRAMGFKPKNILGAQSNQYLITAALTPVVTDAIYVASTGLLHTTAVKGYFHGALASNMIDPDTGLVKTTSESGDYCSVWDDPNEIFVAQISTFTQTDPYTTSTGSTCYDVGGSSGVQYVDAAASTYDIFKICRLASEQDGKQSIVGAYAKVECRPNLLAHVFGVVA